MKLPNFRRIITTDFSSEYQSLVDQLSVTINQGLEVLYSALNKRLTFDDNFQATVKDLDVVVNASGIPKVKTSFKQDSQVETLQVKGLLVVSVRNLTNSAGYPTSGVTISWTQTNDGVSIDHITGLIPDNTYRLRVISLN